VETAGDALLNAAVKRSVERQEHYLDQNRLPSAPRRSSVWSLESALTELTDSEDDGLAPSGTHKSPAPRRPSVSSVESALTELTESEDGGLTPSGAHQGLPLSPAPSSGVNAPIKVQDGAQLAPVVPNKQINHSGRRMRRFRDVGRRRMSKRARTEARRSAASFERAIVVPHEFDDLETSTKPKFERRVYRHEELELLGVRTVRWDGRLVHSVESRVASSCSPSTPATQFPS
jgi:hypothetical protein